MKEPSGLRILAFGDPDLEDEALDLHRAAEELALIRKRIGSTTVLLNEQASEAKAAEMTAGYDILHFAVRGLFDPDDPLRSGLLLTPGAGQDGTLSVLEIFRLRFPGRAVVLSGCDTAAGERPGREGPFRAAAGVSLRGKPVRRFDALAHRGPGGIPSSGSLLPAAGEKGIPCRCAAGGTAPAAQGRVSSLCLGGIRR